MIGTKLAILLGATTLSFCSFLTTKSNRKYQHVYKSALVHNDAQIGTVVNDDDALTSFTTTAINNHVIKLVKTNGPANFTILATLLTSNSPYAKKVYYH
jgi:hypothetical protein